VLDSQGGINIKIGSESKTPKVKEESPNKAKRGIIPLLNFKSIGDKSGIGSGGDRSPNKSPKKKAGGLSWGKL